jgi:hypothetical protein
MGLDPTLFHDTTDKIQVHEGFAEEHTKCDLVLSPFACLLLILISIALLPIPLGLQWKCFSP